MERGKYFSPGEHDREPKTKDRTSAGYLLSREERVLSLRSDLMDTLRNCIVESGLTQKRIAINLGVSQPRISEIVHGKAELFTIDKLVDLLGLMGMEVEIMVRKQSDLDA